MDRYVDRHDRANGHTASKEIEYGLKGTILAQRLRKRPLFFCESLAFSAIIAYNILIL